jgi:hypothetical protein
MTNNINKNSSRKQILARICITVPVELITYLDALRKDIPRSRFIRRILENFTNGGKKTCK